MYHNRVVSRGRLLRWLLVLTAVILPADTVKANDIELAVEIPPGFGRHIKRDDQTSVSVWLDGANPFRAETMETYVQVLHTQFLSPIFLYPLASNKDWSSFPSEVLAEYTLPYFLFLPLS